MKLTVGICTILGCVLLACEQSPPSVPPELAAAYADLLAYRNASKGKDSVLYAAGVDSVLGVHSFDRESFRTALRGLNGDAEQVNDFFDSSLVRLMPSSQKK